MNAVTRLTGIDYDVCRGNIQRRRPAPNGAVTGDRRWALIPQGPPIYLEMEAARVEKFSWGLVCPLVSKTPSQTVQQIQVHQKRRREGQKGFSGGLAFGTGTPFPWRGGSCSWRARLHSQSSPWAAVAGLCTCGACYHRCGRLYRREFRINSVAAKAGDGYFGAQLINNCQGQTNPHPTIRTIAGFLRGVIILV
jgi:hypothetical protein